MGFGFPTLKIKGLGGAYTPFFYKVYTAAYVIIKTYTKDQKQVSGRSYVQKNRISAMLMTNRQWSRGRFYANILIIHFEFRPQ